MGRTYQGYVQAEQSLVEGEDENRNSSEEDVELDLRDRARKRDSTRAGAKAGTDRKRHVSWGPGTAEMSVLHPNIHREDKMHENDSSDDEVPQSFMIEATSNVSARATTISNNTSAVQSSPHLSPRAAVNVTPKRDHAPLPPVVASNPPPTTLIPPRLSELGVETPQERTTQWQQSSPTSHPDQDRQSKPMRSLDAYERALWNWVNVYNLDAFLQEVYYYYEGKGIYSIALARGLNLLSVVTHQKTQLVVTDYMRQDSRIRHWLFDVSTWMRRLFANTPGGDYQTV